MQDFEKLGAFYLGRTYDVDAKAAGEGLVLYDSRDLVTHGVVIGMTGSGKTGLAIDMLEEAGIDGVPAIAIDPKGDLGNLLLGFPDLKAADFKPWINEEDAARKGVSPEEYAEQQAKLWKDGLVSWGQHGDRIKRFRDAVDVVIYTPGSNAGLPLSILKSFDAPPAEIRDDQELFAERVNTSVTGLLTLVGIDADPVQSREHILLSTIVGAAWKAGANLDLGALIERIQTPPVQRVGVLDVESFYPAKDRFALAMRLNGLLAAPGFAAWLEGEALDVGRLFYTESGKPRISVVSIAHLGDAERMFFVSLLLNQVVGWMRRQSGTTSLRALLYMDEVAGYLPPVANPPSKAGFLVLLKQARAFGLGVVLATQNPGDLDYKALSNAGTWLVGRLQTDRDKEKVLQGLEGALGGTGRFNRDEMDQVLSGLGKRVFLMNNVHDDGPTVFETRWTLSYLRGPLTREQIRTLMAARRGVTATGGTAGAAAGPAVGASLPAGQAGAQGPIPAARTAVPGGAAASTTSDGARPPAGALRPVLPPDVEQLFVPCRGAGPPAYHAHLFASGQVQFVDARLGVNEVHDVDMLVPFIDAPVPADFGSATPSDVPLAGLEAEGKAGATYGQVPAAATRAKSYQAWSREFARWLQQTQAIDLQREATTGLTSRPGESERDFRIRLQMALRELRDARKEKLQQQYAPKLASLQEKIRRAQERVAREAEQASQQKLQTVVAVGTSVLGALFGRKTLSAANVGRVGTAARTASRTMKESKDVALAENNVEALKQQLQALDHELQDEIASLEAGGDASQLALETCSIRPKKTHVAVKTLALAWVPQEE